MRWCQPSLRIASMSSALALAAALASVGCTKTKTEAPRSPPAAPATAPVTSTATAPGGVSAPPDVAAPPAAATRTPSGLAWIPLSPGHGQERPGPHDRVTVNYSGWTTGGAMFDSSVARGVPSTMSLDAVMPGWTEGLQLMTKGEKRRFWIPGPLAYGDGRVTNGAPRGTLVFDIELLDFGRTPMPAPPRTLTAPPASATRTPSGLAYEILKHGKGGKHPQAGSMVDLYYAGWTPDGTLFDSALVPGQPATVPVFGVIKGWTEGLQLLAEGDKARFWVPGPLAYGDRPSRPGAPSGPLIFDIELVAMK